MFTNYTPHEITVFDSNGNQLVLPKSESPIRVKETPSQFGIIEGVIIYESHYTPIDENDLPGMEDWEANDRGIVSAQALSAIKKHLPHLAWHFVSPGELVRNAEGQPIGCKGFKV